MSKSIALPQRPRLSLAVAARGECDGSLFLRAIEANGILTASDVDVHIAHDGALSLPYRNLAASVHLHLCPVGSSASRLWGMAIAGSTSPYVAALDIHGIPSASWLRRVRAEIDADTPLFFGAVEPGCSGDNVAIVGYLAEYAQFSEPLSSNLSEVPGNNIVFKRKLCSTDSGSFPEFFKTFMVWDARHRFGIVSRAVVEMAVIHTKPFKLGRYLRTRISQGRAFSARRHQQFGQPSRLLCIGFTPFLPLLRLFRIFRATKRRSDLALATIRYLHFLVLSEGAWSFGEFLGYVTGANGRTQCPEDEARRSKNSTFR